jgi:hypothetical protein
LLFSNKEVGVAISQMAALKAPGLDGFTAKFFQKNWAMIGEEVRKTVFELNSGVMPNALNKTNIILIPKTRTRSCVIEFYLISLCNVLYKVISKVIANRLKKVPTSHYFPNSKHFLSQGC